MKYLSCLLLTVFLSCAADRSPSSLFGPNQAGILVVDATLIVDQALPPLFLRQTIAPNVTYSEEIAAVAGASVSVTQGTTQYDFVEDPLTAGRYLPPVIAPVVLPETSYGLFIRSGSTELQANTTTPKRFNIDEVVLLNEETLQPVSSLRTYRDTPPDVFGAPENQVTYQEHLLEARFERIDVQAYQVGILSLDPASDFVIIGDFLDDEDFRDFERETSSPPLEVAEGNLRLPWFAIAFGGRHQLKIYALDDNWYDFARSSPETQNDGFGGLAGDNFERPIFSIEGGMGLFGSASIDSLGFFVLPRN
ncbi:MAG: DUF4249 family protein [Candidatus Latescibacteria bacterium]|nr:DUF4249 family protein [Candidatus Latescibacterota bacterium]